MNFQNKILYFLILGMLIAFPLNVEAKDCSEFKKLSHKWLKCKAGGVKDIGTKNESSEQSENNTSESPVLEEEDGSIFKSIKKGLKKIREVGGKNIGEPG